MPADGTMRYRPNRLAPRSLVNRNAVTPKYVSRAKLAGGGLGACTNASAAGCAPRNRSIGDGPAAGALAAAPVAAIARSISRNSSPVLVGNPSVPCATMSVWLCSARLNRIAIPGGSFRIEPLSDWSEADGAGELVYSGPNVMLGYAESRVDLAMGDEMRGVLPTGDLGYLDEEGFLYITGRLKRFLKIQGMRLNIDEVEKMLETHLSVLVGCFGHDDHLHFLVETDSPELVAEAKKQLINLYKLHPTAVHGHHASTMFVMASGKKDYSRMQKELDPL